jgi:hypothetical protein
MYNWTAKRDLGTRQDQFPITRDVVRSTGSQRHPSRIPATSNRFWAEAWKLRIRRKRGERERFGDTSILCHVLDRAHQLTAIPTDSYLDGGVWSALSNLF